MATDPDQLDPALAPPVVRAAPPVMAAAAVVPPAPDWYRRLVRCLLWARTNFGTHMFFWSALGAGLYVLFGVAQIKNVWQQWPPDWEWRLLYGAFLVPLLLVYLGWVFVVVGSPFQLVATPALIPIDANASYQWVRQRPVLRFVAFLFGMALTVAWWLGSLRILLWSPYVAAAALAAWLDRRLRQLAVVCAAGLSLGAALTFLLRGPRPLEIAWCVFGGPASWVAFRVAPAWLPWLAARCAPAPNQAADTLRRGAGLLAVAALVAVLLGANPGGSSLYPLSDAFCRTQGLILLGVGLWLWYCAGTPEPAGTAQPTSGWYTGRLLGWCLFSLLIGEAMWILASWPTLGTYVSYRLYTIWAVVHTLTFLALLGLLLDRLWCLFRTWPVRQLAALGVLGFVWFFTHWESLAPDDVESYLSPEQVNVALKADQEAAGNRKELAKARAGQEADRERARAAEEREKAWFDQLQARIDSIPEHEGPVIVVAASGGGAPAAIFTALTLETLRRTPLDPDKPLITNGEGRENTRTWADNIVMISSVSGGSLATAYYVHRLDPIDPKSKHPLVHLPESQPVGDLRNTTPKELRILLAGLAERELKDYPDKLSDLERKLGKSKRPVGPRLRRLIQPSAEHGDATPLSADELRREWPKLHDELKQYGEAQTEADKLYLDALNQMLARVRSDAFTRRLRDAGARSDAEGDEKHWVLKSKAFDEMCLDFMAPILRGTLTPALGRGDALARFWTERFGWYDATNVNGYEKPVNEPNYRPYHPVVLFNTCDVALGSRLVVGFPALPNDLWTSISDDRTLSRARPKPLNELVPGFRVSLARAVRMSSNFPFGFRVQELEVESDPSGRRWVHMLDGGVVDNTGIDTVYELFEVLKRHARVPDLPFVGVSTLGLTCSPFGAGPFLAASALLPGRLDGARDSPYRAQAHAILDGLRRRGVILLEIDAGAKPSQMTPPGYDPLGGTKEPLQALDNAAYTSADLIKARNIDDIRRALNRNLEGFKTRDADSRAAMDALQDQDPKTTFRLGFECNHYLPGQNADDADVMTAWSLGPKDKAKVVQRFLIELELWDRNRRATYRDVRAGLLPFTVVILRDRAAVLFQRCADLAGDASSFARKGPKILAARKAELERQFDDLNAEVERALNELQQLAGRGADVNGEAANALTGAMKTLRVMLNEAQTQVDLAAKPAPLPVDVMGQKFPAPEQWAGKISLGFTTVNERRKLSEAQTGLLRVLRDRPGKLPDPQVDIDRSADRAKAVMRIP